MIYWEENKIEKIEEENIDSNKLKNKEKKYEKHKEELFNFLKE